MPASLRFAPTVAALGKPDYYDEENSVAIYRGDCSELFRRLSAPCFDLVVTSPPYNIGKSYEEPLSLSAYLDWCEDWIRQIHRVTRPSASFWLNLGYLGIPDRAKAIPIPYLLWDRVPFFLLQEIVWQYGAGVAAKLSFSPRNEKFLWYVRDSQNYTFNLDAVRDPDVKYPNQKKNGKLKCNPLGKNPGDVWSIPKVTSGTGRASAERTPHPAQFPTALIERIVLACSNEGDLVLDPFLGSGSTAETCIRHGRSVIGFEILPDYVELAGTRLARFVSRSKEFAAQGDFLLEAEG